MKYLFLSLVLAASSAFAGVDEMVAQCENVMKCDLCKVELDQTVYPPTATKLVLLKTGPRRIPINDYNWIREPQDKKNSRGEYLMCNRVKEAMKQPDSSHGVAARSLFNDQWDGRSYCPQVPDRKAK